MEITGSLSISGNPVQEGQEVARANREGGDAVAFAALLYLILGTPQAGISSIAPEEVKADETEASASGVVPSQKGSGALSIANGKPNDPRAFLANDISPPPAEAAGSMDAATPTRVLTELAASGANFDPARIDGSTPMAAVVAGNRDALIGGGRAEPGAVSNISQDPIEALTAQASVHGKDLAAVNETARVVRDPAENAPIGGTADEVEADPQAEPAQSYEQPAPTASTVGRASAINPEELRTWATERPTTAESTGQVAARGNFTTHVEPELVTEPAGKNHPDLRSGGQFKLDKTAGAVETDPQAEPAQGHERQAPTASTVGRASAVNIAPGTGIVEQPTTAGATAQVVASRNPSNHVEPELATEPGAKIHPDLRSGGEFQVEITADAARNDSQVHPARDFEKPVPGKSNAIQRVHKLGNDSIHAEDDSVNEPAGEIYLGIERAEKFQFGKTTDGDVAEHEARLMAEADTKSDAPRAGRGPAQRLSDIAASVPRADIAAEKFAPAGDPAPASWRSTVNRVADELASHVRLNKHEAVIQLDPPELGKIKIEMRLDGEKLEARIVAEVHESRELIENHLPELRQALRVQHLDLTEVRVSQDPGSGGSGDPMQGFRQQQPDGDSQWARNSENSAAAASASPEGSGSGDENGRVSVWA